MNRIEWDEYFLTMAQVAALRSSCPVRQVGAVFVGDNKAILSIGYNGAPRGTEHCGEECSNRQHGENIEVCKAVHAEVNAIYNAAFNGIALHGSTLYCTLSPCMNCAKALIQVGVTKVVYGEKSAYDQAISFLNSAKIDTLEGSERR